ncbi:MAG: addiction module protein [Gemmataceae bacterium]|nr:addiction module protein [Gemmataceae bacterium]MCI0737435.1 addiction module protein [Gemmataceae bacterium]
MSQDAERIKGQLALLSSRDRAALAHYLIHSLDSEDDGEEVAAAWEAELERRWAGIENGKTVGIPAEQVAADLRKKYS